MEKELPANHLVRIGIFRDVDPADLEKHSRKCVWARVAKGARILEQDEENTDIFFVAQGCVAAKGYSTDGKEVMYTVIRAGELFGEFSAIDGQPRSASIEALEDSHVGHMKSATFRDMLLDLPAAGLALMELLVQKNRLMTRRVFEFSTMPVRQRICAELLRLAEDARPMPDGSLLVADAPSHYQIAIRLSTHREAVSKELAALAAQGIIEAGRKRIRILSLELLRKSASDV